MIIHSSLPLNSHTYRIFFYLRTQINLTMAAILDIRILILEHKHTTTRKRKKNITAMPSFKN